MEGAKLTHAAQLVIPVTGVNPGEVVHFFQKKLLTEADGTQREWWILIDSGIVGDDGMARTTSPPYPGFSQGGQYVCAQSDAPDVTVFFSAATLLGGVQQSAYAMLPVMGFGFFTPAADLYAIRMSQVGWMDIGFRRYLEDRTDEIPYYEQIVTYEIPEGATHLELTIDPPELPRRSPVITGVEYVIVEGEPKIVIRGERLDRAQQVALELADRNHTWFGSAFEDASATSLTVPWPEDAGLILGLTDIYVVAPGGVNSNHVQLGPTGGLGFMSAYDDVGPFVAAFEADIPDDANRMAAKIYLGDAGWKTIYNTVTSVDSTRVYAAVQRGSTSDPWGGVAVIDATTLKQVDEDPGTLGNNFIKLPGAADALAVAMSPRGDFLYVAEWGGAVHVLDVQPDSPNFHQVVQTIQVVTDRNFSGALAVSSDGRRLYVGIAERIGGDGQLAVVNIDPTDKPADAAADLSSASDNPRYWHRVLGTFRTIHTPIQIVATTHPDKLAVTCAFSPHRIYALTVTDDRPDPSHFRVQLSQVRTNLLFPNSAGRADYNIDDAWSVAVMPDLSYAFVSDLNWTVQAHGRINPGANVGIIRDPFSLGEGPLLMAATTPIEYGEANALALSPDGSRLFVSYSGIGEVLVMDTAEMIRAVETEPHVTFIHTPLDQVPGYDVHITPITVAGWAGGFSFQQPNEPPQTTLDDGAVLLTKDYSRTSASPENSYTITIPNTADPTLSQSPMLVTVEIEGHPEQFLVDEYGEPLQTHYEWLVPPGTHKSFEIRAKTLLDDVDYLAADEIYCVKIHVQAFEQHTTGFAMPLDEGDYYVYRYLDAVDATLSALGSASYQAQTDPAHTDGILEMPDTVNDGTGGVVRERGLNVFSPVVAKPQIQVVNEQHFRYEEAADKFIFDPQSVHTNLVTVVLVKTPDGAEAGSLQLRGDGVMQEWFLDRNALKTALTNRVYNSTDPEITTAEKGLVDPTGSPSLLDAVVQSIFDQAKNVLLQQYQIALTDITNSTANSVNFRTFVPSASSSATALGSATSWIT